MPNLNITGDPVADKLLSEDANAVLLAMLLDQQVPMEKAFSGPAVIAARMGGRLDVAAIATAEPARFAELCATPPAVHRFPKAMADRIQTVCAVLVADWDGEAAKLFAAPSGAELKRRIAGLPGFGAQKAAILVALLGKQYGVTPAGWQEAAGDYGLPGHRSVADVTDPASLGMVRAAKRAAKAAAKG